MKCQYQKFLVTFLLCISLAGCGYEKDALTDTLPKMEQESEKLEDINQIGIYVDVTPSMAGFIRVHFGDDPYKVDTYYKTCLRELNEILKILYSEDNKTYYRIDTPLYIVQENVLENAVNDSYYNNKGDDEGRYQKIDLIEEDGEGYDSWCLTNAFLRCRDDDLSILVTDFYENKSASSAVIDALKGIINQKKSVAIIGIKSQFSGTVYDMDPYSEGVLYGSTWEEEVVYRQFYVIVIGEYSAVENICYRLQESMNLSKDKIHYTIFHEEKLYGLGYESFLQCYSRSSNSNDILLEQNSVLINEEVSFDVYQYVNKKNQNKDVIVSYQVPDGNLRQELLKGEQEVVILPDIGEKSVISIPLLVEDLSVFVWNGDTFSDDNKTGNNDVFDLKGFYFSPEDALLYLHFSISSNISIKGNIKLSAQLFMELSNLIDYQWVEQWNLKNGEVDYEKTRNLKEYFDALKLQIPNKKDEILQFVFYLECE